METFITDERASPNSEPLPNKELLSPEFRVISKIGDGGYGAVYDIVDRNYQLFALKVQKVSRTGLQLKKEFDMYDTLLMNAKSGFRTPGIPWVYGYREYEGLEYLVMERLGDNLDQIAGRSEDKQLAKVDVLMIGIQAVRRLWDLHENGILHRDVKPENMAMGNGRNTERTVHIIDFGLARKVEDWATYDYEEQVGFAGTKYYASTEALLNMAPTRRGDLECLAYSLLSLACGGLPWVYNDPKSGRPFRDSEIGMQRLQSRPIVCTGFPELKGFFEAVSNMERAEKPNYEHLIALLEAAVEEFEGENSGDFEWLEPTAYVKSFSYILSENHQQHQDHVAMQINTRTRVKNFTETEPEVPRGFCFENVRREERSVIQVKILRNSIRREENASHTVEELTPPSTSESSVLLRTAIVDTTPFLEQCNGGDIISPLLCSKCSRVKKLPTTEDEKQKNLSQESSERIVPGSGPSESHPSSPQCEYSSGVKFLFTSLLVMSCYLAFLKERTTSNDNQQLLKHSEETLTVREKVKEENASEVMKECEGISATRVELEMEKPSAGCRNYAPKPSESRKGRKRGSLKRLVSRGVSRAARTAMGWAISKFVVLEGLRS